MMRSLKSAVLLAGLATFVWPAAAQDIASSIVGVWKQTSLVEKDVVTGRTKPFYGQQQGGYRVFTRGGFTMIFNIYTPRKAPAATAPTQAEGAELFKSMSVYSGTYKVEGNKVIVRVDASWIESWTGTERVNSVEMSGNKLTMTVGPFKNVIDGKEVVLVSTLERVE